MSDNPNPPDPYGRPAPEPSGQPPTQQAKGFFGALFDFKFDHFITPMLVRAVYLLALVVLVLGWLFYTLTIIRFSVGLGLIVLLMGPVLILLYLAFIRMTLEIYLAVVRMSEDIHHRLPRA